MHVFRVATRPSQQLELFVALRPFHLAIPVDNLESAEAFYSGVLGARVCRRDGFWIDFDFMGHQLTTHQVTRSVSNQEQGTSLVGEDMVPIPHFGIILGMSLWRAMASRLEQRQDIDWVIFPKVRFQNSFREQATMFFRDPSGNKLEFKAFHKDASIFEASEKSPDIVS